MIKKIKTTNVEREKDPSDYEQLENAYLCQNLEYCRLLVFSVLICGPWNMKHERNCDLNIKKNLDRV